MDGPTEPGTEPGAAPGGAAAWLPSAPSRSASADTETTTEAQPEPPAAAAVTSAPAPNLSAWVNPGPALPPDLLQALRNTCVAGG